MYSALVLTQEDLIDRFKSAEKHDISHFRGVSVLEYTHYSMVVFLTESGEIQILKQRPILAGIEISVKSILGRIQQFSEKDDSATEALRS